MYDAIGRFEAGRGNTTLPGLLQDISTIGFKRGGRIHDVMKEYANFKSGALAESGMWGVKAEGRIAVPKSQQQMLDFAEKHAISDVSHAQLWGMKNGIDQATMRAMVESTLGDESVANSLLQQRMEEAEGAGRAWGTSASHLLIGIDRTKYDDWNKIKSLKAKYSTAKEKVSSISQKASSAYSAFKSIANSQAAVVVGAPANDAPASCGPSAAAVRALVDKPYKENAQKCLDQIERVQAGVAEIRKVTEALVSLDSTVETVYSTASKLVRVAKMLDPFISMIPKVGKIISKALQVTTKMIKSIFKAMARGTGMLAKTNRPVERLEGWAEKTQAAANVYVEKMETFESADACIFVRSSCRTTESCHFCLLCCPRVDGQTNCSVRRYHWERGRCAEKVVRRDRKRISKDAGTSAIVARETGKIADDMSKMADDMKAGPKVMLLQRVCSGSFLARQPSLTSRFAPWMGWSTTT